MNDWNDQPPPPEDIGDREVPLDSEHLLGRRVALMVTGSIAALKAPLVARALRRRGAEVVAFVSAEGLRYVAEDALEWATVNPVVTRLTPAAEHLSDATPFDVFLCAPATYNTINKLAAGIADGPVTTTLASALGRMERGQAQVLVAPAMHGTLHNSILTDSLRRLRDLGVRIIPPREAYGKHNIPETEHLVAEVIRATSQSPLRGRRALVVGGTATVSFDGWMALTGCIGLATTRDIAWELYYRGAAVHLIEHGRWTGEALPFPRSEVWNRRETRGLVFELMSRERPEIVLISEPELALQASREKTLSVEHGGSLYLAPERPLAEELREAFPGVHVVPSFPLEGCPSPNAESLGAFPAVMVLADREERRQGKPLAWLVSRTTPAKAVEDRSRLSRAVADLTEDLLAPQGRYRTTPPPPAPAP